MHCSRGNYAFAYERMNEQKVDKTAVILRIIIKTIVE